MGRFCCRLGRGCLGLVEWVALVGAVLADFVCVVGTGGENVIVQR